MVAHSGDLLTKSLWEKGRVGIAVASDTIATPATGDTITFTNFWPADETTRLGVLIVTSSRFDTNASPGTLTVGDGTTANGYIVATSMGNHSFASGTGSLLGTVASSRDLKITLGTVGTAGSGVIVTAFGYYTGGDTIA